MRKIITGVALAAFATVGLTACTDDGTIPAPVTVTHTAQPSSAPGVTPSPARSIANPEQAWTEMLSANGFSFDSPKKAINFGNIVCQMKLEGQPDGLVIQKINSIVADSTTAAGRGSEILRIAKSTICLNYGK